MVHPELPCSTLHRPMLRSTVWLGRIISTRLPSRASAYPVAAVRQQVQHTAAPADTSGSCRGFCRFHLSKLQQAERHAAQQPGRLHFTTSLVPHAAPSAALLSDYDAQQIQVLEGLDPVRKRPGMYIGSTGQRGLHHLIYEVLDNCIDEVQGGHAQNVKVQLDLTTGVVSITDDGRGIPTDIHPATGKSALETVLTVLHAGGKFGGVDSGYSVSGGLHGVGISVVNALSESLRITVWRQGRSYEQTYERGRPLTDLKETLLPKERAKATGTHVEFKYDKTVFSKGISIDPETIRARLRELAFLNSTASIWFRTVTDADQAENAWEKLHFSGGLKEFAQWLNREKQPLHEPIYVSKQVDGVQVDVAMQWCSDMYSDSLVGFVNSVKTIDGGTHLDGLKAALTRTFNALARKSKALKEGEPNLSGDHIREGLTAVISVKVPNPEFEGQTKTRLGNPEVRKIVDGVVSTGVTDAFEADTATFSAITSKALQAFKASEAAKKARELVRRKSVLVKSTLPGKLADCSTTDLAESEIFVVEGDSAGGSAKQARDRRFQAILPLRGKILNVERKDDTALYQNAEISNLIIALGLRVDNEEPTPLRYGKVILLTDADVDGAHIRTLLLTFLYRYQRQLFEQGCVYVGMPPLYKVEAGKKSRYCYDDAELAQALADLGGHHTFQRFKGLGEMMPEQLWQTTLNPASRTLRQLNVSDAAAASDLFSLLMGGKVEPRRALIEAHGSRMSLSDLDI